MGSRRQGQAGLTQGHAARGAGGLDRDGLDAAQAGEVGQQRTQVRLAGEGRGQHVGDVERLRAARPPASAQRRCIACSASCAARCSQCSPTGVMPTPHEIRHGIGGVHARRGFTPSDQLAAVAGVGGVVDLGPAVDVLARRRRQARAGRASAR